MRVAATASPNDITAIRPYFEPIKSINATTVDSTPARTEGSGAILNNVDLGRTHYRDYYYAGHYYYGSQELSDADAAKAVARRKVG